MLFLGMSSISFFCLSRALFVAPLEICPGSIVTNNVPDFVHHTTEFTQIVSAAYQSVYTIVNALKLLYSVVWGWSEVYYRSISGAQLLKKRVRPSHEKNYSSSRLTREYPSEIFLRPGSRLLEKNSDRLLYSDRSQPISNKSQPKYHEYALYICDLRDLGSSMEHK